MRNKIINIIRPLENAAEKEYLKEFFRYVGCFSSDLAIDEDLRSAWRQGLRPAVEPGGVDVVLNYFGEDPYLQECRRMGIRRLYCYFSFSKMFAGVSERPILSPASLPAVAANVPALRRTVLEKLIQLIWSSEPEDQESVQRIASLYTNVLSQNIDLYHCIQIRRCLRFLKMDEVLSEPNAHIASIRYTATVQDALEGLWYMWECLTPYTDPYSQFAQIKSAKMIADIVMKLPENAWGRIRALSKGRSYLVPSLQMLTDKLQSLVARNPDFISAQVYLAGLSRHVDSISTQGDAYYRAALGAVPRERRDYAFIWYRLGRFHEKKHHDHRVARRYYEKAVDVDCDYYQALFKLGYYAAAEGRYDEAEKFLLRTIRAIFHRRDSQHDEEKKYDYWQLLSQTEIQYAFKAYMLLAKIAIKTNREYSAKFFIADACFAAMIFERAKLVQQASDRSEFVDFWGYHHLSEPVWAMWKILEPWTEDIIRDFRMRDIVREKLNQWSHKK